MPISAATIAAHHPWGNAVMAFTVSAVPTVLVADEETGNMVPASETLEYLAHLELGGGNWKLEEGLDETTYQCRGHLLSPIAFDERVGTGSVARCTLNGQAGLLELTFDLAQRAYAYPVQRQTVQGRFRVTGGGHG